MKKNKKKILIGISVLLVVAISILLLIFISNNNKNALNLEENKWIDSNKYNVIDIALINEIPIVSYEGNGFIYDYLDYVTDELSLKFNIIPFKLDEKLEYNYKMEIVKKINKNDLVLLNDNLILVTKDDKQYSNLDEIENLKIGILKEDKEDLTTYFKDKNITFVEYEKYEELKKAINDAKTNYKSNTETSIDGIIIMKSLYTKELLENSYNISYQFNDLNKYIILKTSGDKNLNSILFKLYNSWKNENYETKYNENLLTDYFKFKNISDVEQKNLKSKKYVYGFINYGIYNYLDNNKISGLSGLLLKDFNNFSGLAISYTRYNSLSKLLTDFNSKKVDFLLNVVDESSYKNNVYNTTGIFNKKLAIISGNNNKDIITNINSLKDKTVLTIRDSYLEKYLINNNVKVKLYNNMKDLTNEYGLSDIAIVDLENYNYYKSSAFKDSKINYLYDFDDKYNFIINDTVQNEVFKGLFDFYLDYFSIDNLITKNYKDIAYENKNYIYILIIIIIILCIYVVIDFLNHFKVMIKTIKKNKKVHLTKEEKIKYIDQLTSLKNRAYLNSRIESWDDSEVYPQSIIVIDLNNIAYINDNYGREEGDKVITEAANILIMHQLQNSEIIRTDGNEFLIYLVGYSEKQIISYLRKLNKELKNLSHGFGAASGYSIITDAIKTVDDAVNEATLDMKNNKEDIEY